MCRLMIADGAQPEKVWIYGNLKVNSINKPAGGYCPECIVCWGWHVAPTLQVNTSNGVETWVVDPSLFTEAIPQTTWSSVQGDPMAVLEASSADIFTRSQGGGSTSTDPTYSSTNATLTTYRNNLMLRSAGPEGPPPYFPCMTLPPGAQWFGSLAPNQTQSWFTWGWGAQWHVVWTIMPLTECPGAAQLSWTVEVERASATDCTYWITVTNLTPEPVKFEGRYDVLSW
jgi:hypothetical protein